MDFHGFMYISRHVQHKCKNEKNSEGNQRDPTRSFSPILVTLFQTFPKAREKNVPRPHGTSTTSLLRKGKRCERLYQEKTALFSKDCKLLK